MPTDSTSLYQPVLTAAEGPSPAASFAVAIAVRNVSKMYPLYADPRDRLRQSLWYALPKFLRGQPKEFYREFWAVRDVSFEVKRGETVGIIGRNGSGKSTLLQIIAGTLAPTHGEVQVNGRVAALLELGSGFNPEFTGRENVYLNGAILGFSREEMDERFDEIAAFADIGQFIDQPVKFYSSGMFVRLAFAVQACVEPDILIVDEALAVGDVFFQQKCYARIDRLSELGSAIILVSHDAAVVEKFSHNVLLLDHGNCLFWGQSNEAVQRYYLLEFSNGHNQVVQPSISPESHSKWLEVNDEQEATQIVDWPDPKMFVVNLDKTTILGGEKAHFQGVVICNEAGVRCNNFEMGEIAHFFYEFETYEDIAVPVGGITITNTLNVNVHGKNSAQYLLNAPSFVPAGSRIRFKQTFQLSLAPGQYTFSVGFSTISPINYANFRHIPYAKYNELATVLLIAQQAGSFQIRLRSSGSDLPYHGVADLPGYFHVQVVQ
jgi:lipopolysaccharide transport system ATP-binding protein